MNAAAHGTDHRQTVLSVRDLRVSFPAPGLEPVEPVRGVSLDLKRATRVGLVGESGSGKSLTALAMMRLVDERAIVTGHVTMKGRELLTLSEREMCDVRGRDIAMVYQDPMSALNPVFSIGRQLVETIKRSGQYSRQAAQERAAALLAEVGVSDPRRRLDAYPHEFSGGMRQRVVIAMALAAEPEVIIADEPTTALDVTTQATIIALLGSLVDSHGLSVLLITHDLGVAASMCDEVNVMYAGRIVEASGVEDFYRRPTHPYSEALLNSICRLDADVGQPILSISGMPPMPGGLPVGCAFHPRCPQAIQSCRTETPTPISVGMDHHVECLLATPSLSDARSGRHED